MNQEKYSIQRDTDPQFFPHHGHEHMMHPHFHTFGHHQHVQHHVHHHHHYHYHHMMRDQDTPQR